VPYLFGRGRGGSDAEALVLDLVVQCCASARKECSGGGSRAVLPPSRGPEVVRLVSQADFVWALLPSFVAL
jgi:hypothetical protein